MTRCAQGIDHWQTEERRRKMTRKRLGDMAPKLRVLVKAKFLSLLWAEDDGITRQRLIRRGLFGLAI